MHQCKMFIISFIQKTLFQKVKGNIVQNFIRVQEGATVNFGGQNSSEIARSSSRSEETFETENEVSFIKTESKQYKYSNF